MIRSSQSTVKVLLVAASLSLTGCATMTAQDVISGVNTYRMLSGGPYYGANLAARVQNCMVDAIDPQNRGSGCN